MYIMYVYIYPRLARGTDVVGRRGHVGRGDLDPTVSNCCDGIHVIF